MGDQNAGRAALFRGKRTASDELPLRRRRHVDIHDVRVLYFMLIPGVIYYLLFKYGPMYGLLIAFKDYNIFAGFGGSPWVGLKHFQRIFSSPSISRTITNTLYLNLLNIVFGFPIPIIVALILNELKNKAFVRINQSILYLPHFFSWVIIGGIILQMSSVRTGVVNKLITGIGLPAIPFLTDVGWWTVMYIVSGIWKETGWGSIIYYAALQGVPTELYEAATIDGASRWKQVFHISLPSIAPTIATLLILRVGRVITIGFEQPYMLRNSMVLSRADVLSTYIFEVGIRQARFSITTALGLFQSLVGLLMIVVADRIVKSMGQQGIL